MFNPSRQEARQFLFDTWRKHRARMPLMPLESMALDVALMHPEYHGVLDQPEKYLDKDYMPEFGDTNPFLHMSMHLAISEQLSIDQPSGICAAYQRLLATAGEQHRAQHVMLDCLAEMIWLAQRSGSSPDGRLYLECLGRH